MDKKELEKWTGTGLDCITFTFMSNSIKDLHKEPLISNNTHEPCGEIYIKQYKARVKIVLPDLLYNHNAHPWGQEESKKWEETAEIIYKTLENHNINCRDTELMSVTAEVNSTQEINTEVSGVLRLLNLAFLDKEDQSAIYSQLGEDRSPKHTGTTAVYKKKRNDFIIKAYDKGEKLRKDGKKNVPNIPLLRIEFIIKQRRIESLYNKNNKLENVLQNPEILLKEYKELFYNVLWKEQVRTYLLDVNRLMVSYLTEHDKDRDKYITMVAKFSDRIVDARQIKRAIKQYAVRNKRRDRSTLVLDGLYKRGVKIQSGVIKCLGDFYSKM